MAKRRKDGEGEGAPLPPDLLAAIKKFSGEAETLSNALSSELDKHPRPSLVYHYTNDEGLHGILKSGSFRTTDIFYLNDPSELRHGIAPALEALRKAGAARSSHHE